MKEIGTIYDRAMSEWELFTREYGVSGVVSLQLAETEGVTGEGYSLQTDDKGAVITAPTERGLLYGVFYLMEKYRLEGGFPKGISLQKSPAFQDRIIWSWGRLNNGYRHAPYLKHRSLLHAETIADPEKNPEMMRFLRNMAGMGANALVLTHELHHFEIKDYDQHGFRPFYPQIRAFAKYLKSWGIDLYLYTSGAPEPDFKKNVADKDCCFDPQVKQFWSDTVGEIMEAVPELAGMLIAGGLGGYAGGGLYSCTCDYCKNKTSMERVKQQIDVIADCLQMYGKKLIYTVTTDLPFIVDREVDCIMELKDSIPANTILTYKDCYHDYEELRYPEHPVFGHLEAENTQKEQNLAVEYQLFQEMRGKGVVISNIAEVWGELFQKAHALKQKAAVGVIETHPDNAHPAMADWYAWGRYCWEPELDARQVLEDWAALEYSQEAAPVVADILQESYHAAGKLLYAAGVQNGSHGMIIPKPYFIRDILNDTWCPKEKQPDGVIGSDDRQLALYVEERRKEIEEDPAFELFVHARRVDAPLTERLLKEKKEAIDLFADMYQKWQEAAELFEPDDYRYRELLRLLQENASDAQRYYVYFQIFLHWQAGILTVEEIEQARREYVGTGQVCSLYTCDTLLNDFLTHTRYILEKIPFDPFFDCVYHLPQYGEEEQVWQITQLHME